MYFVQDVIKSVICLRLGASLHPQSDLPLHPSAWLRIDLYVLAVVAKTGPVGAPRPIMA
jgi:hypothetical protein